MSHAPRGGIPFLRFSLSLSLGEASWSLTLSSLCPGPLPDVLSADRAKSRFDETANGLPPRVGAEIVMREGKGKRTATIVLALKCAGRPMRRKSRLCDCAILDYFNRLIN